jgi:hypothetical protein
MWLPCWMMQHAQHMHALQRPIINTHGPLKAVCSAAPMLLASPSLLTAVYCRYENEDLIKYGLPCDLWFHVDDLSSAHVYLRLPDGATMDDIPEDTLEDCAQLVKQNSIQGGW